MSKGGVAALIIHTPVNVSYYSGFVSSYCFLVILPKAAYVVTDGRYMESARELEGFEAVGIQQGGQPVEIGRLLREAKVKKAGFEPEITQGTWAMLVEICEGIELVATPGLITGPRAHKAHVEIEAIEASQRLNEKIFLEALQLLSQHERGTVTERQFAGLLKILMLDHDVEPSFEPIVAFGLNGMHPHYRPGATPIDKGLILIDMGVKLNGYCSDMTRMVHLGKPVQKIAKLHEAVRQAKNAAIAAMKPGIVAKDVHAIAVAELEKSKLAKLFIHGLGHGVGMEIHEGPRLNGTSEAVLEPGQVVTVEPGIYDPKWGGIRIEDMVVVTDEGTRNLTSLSDDLLVL
jgi:Xaa-Pro aminopeptidase